MLTCLKTFLFGCRVLCKRKIACVYVQCSNTEWKRMKSFLYLIAICFYHSAYTTRFVAFYPKCVSLRNGVHKQRHLSNMDWIFITITDLLYLPHSVAFCNGHREAVAMKPARLFNTRVRLSSPLQHGTIVPWANGVAFVSLVLPISVPIFK